MWTSRRPANPTRFRPSRRRYGAAAALTLKQAAGFATSTVCCAAKSAPASNARCFGRSRQEANSTNGPRTERPKCSDASPGRLARLPPSAWSARTDLYTRSPRRLGLNRGSPLGHGDRSIDRRQCSAKLHHDLLLPSCRRQVLLFKDPRLDTFNTSPGTLLFAPERSYGPSACPTRPPRFYIRLLRVVGIGCRPAPWRCQETLRERSEALPHIVAYLVGVCSAVQALSPRAARSANNFAWQPRRSRAAECRRPKVN